MKLFKWIKSKVQLLIDKIRPNAKKAIAIVSVLKQIVESPVLDLAVGSTKTNIDNIALSGLRKFIPDVLLKMEISDLFIQGNNADEMIEAFADYLRKKNKGERSKFYLEFSAYIVDCMKDGEFSYDEKIGAVALIFKELKDK